MPSKQLGGSNFDSGRTPRQFLMDYYKSAIESLLFLRNIKSISFREISSSPDLAQGLVREKSSEKLVWGVSSEEDHVDTPRYTRIRELTIKGHIDTTTGPKQTSTKWCVISGRKTEDDLSDALVKIQMQDRLEAKYGLAALISKTANFRGRNYMSLPLRKPGTMEIPVHVDAVSSACGYFSKICSTLNIYSPPELGNSKQQAVDPSCRFGDGGGLNMEQVDIRNGRGSLVSGLDKIPYADPRHRWISLLATISIRKIRQYITDYIDRILEESGFYTIRTLSARAASNKYK